MASTTTNFQIPFPGQGDAANVPADLQAMAARVDAVLKSVSDTATATQALVNARLGNLRVFAKRDTITAGPSYSYTRSYTFPSDVTFSAVPIVGCQLATAAGGTTKIECRPSATTTTGFTVWIHTWDNSVMGDLGAMPLVWWALGAA